MALWNQTPPANNDHDDKAASGTADSPSSTAIPMGREGASRIHRESVLGVGVTLEGKIEGDGDVRIGGTIKGEIRIGGDLVVDRGGRLAAKVSAANVTLGGELQGDVTATGQVKLLESSQLVGNLKASTLTVAAGSRMRGNVEFGWSSTESKKFVNGEAREPEKKAGETKAGTTPTV